MRITKEPEERRQEIFDAALKLFGEKGYEKITITDIAKSIGYLRAFATVISHQRKYCLTARLSSMRIYWYPSLPKWLKTPICH